LGINIINDLLFWTDNLNPPRKLNVTRNYLVDGFEEDDISVIVKPPLFAPIINMGSTLPVGGAGNITGQENNLEETFVEFSYRYKYLDNEYSAMAPFSSAAFNASVYQYDYANWYLKSMTNANNLVNITFRVGGPQVKEIQLLFRESQSTNVYVVESYDYSAPFNWDFGDNAQAGAYAAAVALTTSFPGNVAFTTQPGFGFGLSGEGIPDSYEVGDTVFIDQDPGFTHASYNGEHIIVEIIDRYTIVIDVLFAGATPVESGSVTLETKTIEFVNNKIYTVLPSDELGRLFDNVPLKALGQELIGSRLVYGNYVQFFDLVNQNNEAIALDFDLYLESRAVGGLPERTFRSDRDYEIGICYLDSYGRMTTVLTARENNLYISPDNSNSVNDIQVYINSPAPSFASHYRLYIKQAKGDYQNIIPSFFVQEGLKRWFQIGPGDINKVKKGEYLICKHTPEGPTFSNTQYKVLDIESKPKDFLNIPGTPQTAGVYFCINDPSGLFNTASLDIYATTNSSVGGPVGFANLGNIFYSQIDNPIFYGQSTTADRVKVVAVPGIAASTAHQSAQYKAFRIKLTVVNGATNEFKYEFMSQEGAYSNPLMVDTSLSSFTLTMSNNPAAPNIFYNITVNSVGAVIYGDPVAAVVWPDLPNSYLTNDYFIINVHSEEAKYTLDNNLNETQGSVPVPATTFSNVGYPKDKVIQAGAQITFKLTHHRSTGENYEDPAQVFISSKEYLNLEEWFWEDQIYSAFNNLTPEGTSGGFGGNQSNTGASLISFARAWATGVNSSGNTYDVWQSNTSGPFSGYANWNELLVSEGSICMRIGTPISALNAGTGVGWSLTVTFEVIQTPGLTVFETLPADNVPEIYFETNKTFAISNGVHEGNLQNQVLGQSPAKVSLNPGVLTGATTEDKENSNFNAWVFSNALESYRIKDAWNGYQLKYSPRASTVIDDYEEQRAAEALTYSGIYRENTGVNNLNEFNLSIANFRYLDKFFGSIQKLHARDTDVIVFQEDKITKVLYGKNLLNDAIGGGDIVSIPEVLGTQIPFEGEYGISSNPESFDYWGPDMFCTDAKRGSVLSINSQGIYPISSSGMMDYFKDVFISSPNTRKIGGVDPFKQFYTLFESDIEFPCTFKLSVGKERPWVNPFDLSWRSRNVCVTISSNATWGITLVDTGDGTAWCQINGFPGPTYSGLGNAQVCFNFNNNNSGATRSLQIIFQGCDESYVYNVNQSAWRPIEVDSWVIGSPILKPLNPVCVVDDGEYVSDVEYDFSSNTGGPIEFPSTRMRNKPISFVNRYKGIAGQQSVPTPGDTVTLKAYTAQTLSKQGFNIDFGNTLRYLVSDVPYTEEQVEDLLALSTAAPLVPGAGFVEGSFTFNVPNDEGFLYLIWDFRNIRNPGVSIVSPSGSEGTTYHSINYNDTVGVSRINYNANAIANRFRVKYGNTEVFDTGFVVGAGSFNIQKSVKEIESACLIVETSGVDDGWDVVPDPTALTSFLTNNAGTTFPLICAAPVPVTTRWHNGINPLPVLGDTIFENPFGSSVLPGGDLYWRVGVGPDGDYVSFGDDGVVFIENNCAACTEVAVPVITVPDLNLELGQEISLQLTATNNPESWNLVSSCVSYSFLGGETGGIYEYTSCEDGVIREVSVPLQGRQVICSSTVPVLIDGSDSSFTVVDICEAEVMPPTLRLDQFKGVLSGTITETGVYPIVIEATNCFGTSAPTTFVVDVINASAYRRFNMNTNNPETNALAACGVAATYRIYYHSGLSPYPVVNDFVYFRSDRTGEYFPYNGGYLWYLTDGGEAIRIDSVGQVVDVSICGVTKTTEAGDDKTTENDLDKTIE